MVHSLAQLRRLAVHQYSLDLDTGLWDSTVDELYHDLGCGMSVGVLGASFPALHFCPQVGSFQPTLGRKHPIIVCGHNAVTGWAVADPGTCRRLCSPHGSENAGASVGGGAGMKGHPRPSLTEPIEQPAIWPVKCCGT